MTTLVRESVPIARPRTARTPRPEVRGAGRRARRTGPVLWWAAVVVVALLPLGILSKVRGLLHTDHWYVASMTVALVATSLLVAAYVLPSRLRTITTALGVERLLKGHRALALTATALVAVHVVVVLVHHGLGVLDLRDAPPRVWAATTATVALALLVVLGVTRRRRRPRYEGWRLVHVVLAQVLMVGTALHVYWLADLTRFAPGAVWFAGLAVVVLLVSGHRWVMRPRRAREQVYEVSEVRQASPTAVTLVLDAIGHPGVRFRPGQFAWLKIGGSHVFEEHPFTIASAATRPWRKEFTIKALGDFSELVAGLRPGRRVHLDGPHGSFTIDGLTSPGFVMIAGGVGITPMLSMLRTMADRGDLRPVVLVVAGRTTDELLHGADREHLTSLLDLRVVEVVTAPPEGWTGQVGRVGRPVLEAAVPGRRSRRNFDYFVCGPGPMVDTATRVLEEWGVRASRVHTELFDVV